MKFTDGLWLRVAREVAAENPEIEFETGSPTTCACSSSSIPRTST